MKRFFVFLLSAVLLLTFSACKKETASQPVLSQWDYFYSPAETEQIDFRNDEVVLVGIQGDVLVFKQKISTTMWRFFAANLQTGEIGTIGEQPGLGNWTTLGGLRCIDDQLFLSVKNTNTIYGFSLENSGFEEVYSNPDSTLYDLSIMDGKFYYRLAFREKVNGEDEWVGSALACFDPQTGKQTILTERKVENGKADHFRHFSCANGKLYTLTQSYYYPENRQQVTQSTPGLHWRMEVFSGDGALEKTYSMELEMRKDNDTVTTKFAVCGNYLFVGKWYESSFYQIDEEELKMIAFGGDLDHSSTAFTCREISGSGEKPEQLLMISGRNWLILDPESKSLYVVDCPQLRNREDKQISETYYDGANMIYYAPSGDEKEGYYYAKLEDLMEEARRIPLEDGKVLNLSDYGLTE